MTVSVTPDMKLSVYIRYPDGVYQTVTKDFQLPTAPSTLKFGFAGSTGGSTNFHEIRNNRVVKPADLTTTVSDGHVSDSRTGTYTWTVTVANSNDNDTLGNTVVATSPNSSLTNVSWTCTSTAGTCGTASGIGLPDTTNDLPKGATATYIVTAQAADTADNAQLAIDAQPTGATGELNPTDNAATDTTDLTPVADANPSIAVANNAGLNGTATATAGTYRGGDLAITRNWQSCDPEGTNCADIPGATGTTYAMGTTMRDHALRLREHVANGAGAIDAYSPVYATFPDTTVTGAPSGATNSTSASFTSSSDKTGAAFECELDGSGWSACTSAKSYSGLSDGSHTTRFRAVYAALADQTPVTRTWTVDTTPPAAPDLTVPRYTNDTTPAIDFTAEPNSTVTIYVDGLAVGTSTADADGNGSFTLPTPLSEGDHAVQATAADGVGNVSAVSTASTLTVDLTTPAAPTVTSPTDGTVTADPRPELDFTGEPFGRIDVYVDGAKVGSVTADNLGHATYTRGTDLTDGGHTVTATTTDRAGNTGPDSAATRFTVDTIKPNQPVITAPAEGTHTNDTTPAVTFGAEPGAYVDLYAGGTLLGSATADADGNGSITVSPALADGPYDFVVRATDAAGNVSDDSEPVNVVVDTAAPAAPAVTAPADALVTRDTAAAVVLTGEPGADLEVDVDGTIAHVVLDGSGDGTLHVAGPLADGPHTVRARATDAAGNTGPWSADTTWTVKTSTHAALTGPPAGPTASAAQTVAYTGEPGATYEILVDGHVVATGTIDGSGQGSVALPSALADGSHTLAVRVTDVAGNVDSHSTTVDVDTSAPAPVRFTTAPAEQSSQSSPTFAFAGEAGGTLECALDNGAWTACASLHDLADGPHVLRVRVRDAAGNASIPQPYAWTVDTTPPAPPTLLGGPDSRTTDHGARFELTAEPGATLECSVDGKAFTPCSDTVSLDGLGSGRHSLTVRQLDEAGNVSRETSYAWTVQKTVRETRSHRVVPALAAKVTVSDERALAVGCNLDAGALRSCRVALYHDGHRIGRRTVTSHGAHGRAVVHVRLNARGRRLLRSALGGLHVHVRLTARNTKAQTLHASAAGTIYPPRVFSVPILFATDRADLTRITTRITRRIADQVRHARSIVCEGYTDSRGTAADNYALGLHRARTVCARLRAMGVHTHTHVVSYGETRPRTSNLTWQGRALNRQVVVRVSY